MTTAAEGVDSAADHDRLLTALRRQKDAFVVMVKMPEITAHTAELTRSLVQQYFDDTELTVVTGGPDTAAAITALPFDHLFITGSPTGGAHVQGAAAANLVPVTLELGGKNPVVVGPRADLRRSAVRIAKARMVNGGQVCVCRVNRFRTAPPQDRAHARPRRAADDAHCLRRSVRPGAVGARFTTTAGAIDHINNQPAPLVAYWFGPDDDDFRTFVRRTRSGGVARNDCAAQMIPSRTPRSAVSAAAGMGAYHGKAGFDAFSHHRSVVGSDRPFSITGSAAPPFGAAMRAGAELRLRVARRRNHRRLRHSNG
jgi:acyl-CoA reductase-like NAD-dependent aldehyde dehydrogenase